MHAQPLDNCLRRHGVTRWTKLPVLIRRSTPTMACTPGQSEAEVTCALAADRLLLLGETTMSFQ